MRHIQKDLQRIPSLFLAAALACTVSGCSKPPTDAELTSSVQAALKGDSAISKQPVQVAVQNGVVTLSGNVSDDTASTVAAQDAARVKGVKEVVDQLTVAGIQVAPTVTSPTAPTQPRQTTTEERQTLAQGKPLPPPPAAESSSAAAPKPAAPPQPTYRDITAPEGTVIPIRITEGLSSQTAQDGQPFNGTVTHEVVRDGYVIIPAGSAVSGRVVVAKDAGHFKGHSELSIELTAVRRHGQLLNIATSAYTLEGKNRGKNSAVKIGGGAAVGAVLGGIFGGGKGAAIGSLAGGGGGAALQGFTRGQQVSIPSESLIRFRLARPLTVRTTEKPSNYAPTTLQERDPATADQP
jgi:hypothetical protein